MKEEAATLYEELSRSPEDWSVRLRLIECAVSEADFEEARRLVRTSPDGDNYLPSELQDRIHALLTGAPRQESFEMDDESGES